MIRSSKKLPALALMTLAVASTPVVATAGIDIGVNIGIPEVVIRTQPPADRIEVIPMSPGPDHIWIRGHWVWHHERWEWKGGYWEAVHPNQVWISGQWVQKPNGWVWVEGHYVVQAPPAPPQQGQVAEVIANEPPPPPITEVVTVAPGPDYFWVSGHWHWRGGWVWVHGHYDRHPHFHPGGAWVDGHWDRRGGNFVWVEGHWR